MSEELLLAKGFNAESISILKDLLNVEKLSLNEMQKKFIEADQVEKDKLIISAPPSSGKTLTAYLKFVKNRQISRNRMIYLVPYLRMRKEIISKLKKIEKYGITITDDLDNYEEGKAQVLISTYSAIDNSLLHGKKLASDLFVFDEFDMVTDDLQGTKTEGVIARILRESETIALYAISGTIGSPDVVEKWLGCETFTNNYRPGDFKKLVKEFTFTMTNSEIIEEIFNSEINEKKPMLVFYYDTKKCRKTAVEIAKAREARVIKVNQEISEGVKEIVTDCDATAEVSDEVKALNNGIAFYFSRIQPQCKEVIERLLEKNVLDIVFTTPALARGINMPVRTVVIPFPFKFTNTFGLVPLSRGEMEQILGRAARPPFHAKGSGIIVTTTPDRTKQFDSILTGTLEPMSSKFLQSSGKKGRILNRSMLATEIIKEAKMQNRPQADLLKVFDNYLFMQEITNKDFAYRIIADLTGTLLKAGLLEENIDGEIITPEIVDIVIDNGIDDVNVMLCLINLSKDVINNRVKIKSGHILSTILYQLCLSVTDFGVSVIKDKYEAEKVQKYILEKTQIQPEKIENEHRLFMALDLYYKGMALEKIESDFGIESDGIPFISDRIAHNLVLLGRLITKQSMGNGDMQSFSDFLEICSSVIKKGLPYQILPFGELVDRLGRKTALKILEKYPSEHDLLKVLSDEARTEREFKEIEGIGRTLGQRIIEKRKDLIANLQRKISLWGTYNF